MLDEPFSALDAFLKEKLQLELLELLSGYDKDILMVTHSRDEIYRFCEHMLIVENGRQAGFGVTKEIFKNPGTPAAAKLTGCKNIEKIERVDDHTMVLPNWNTTVCVKDMIPENTTHIGIRAHYLRLPENGQRENLVECQNGRILDDPFELVVENPERKLAERIPGKNATVSRYPGGEYSISARIKLANCNLIFYNKK